MILYRATWADGRTLLFASPSIESAREAVATLGGKLKSVKEVKK